MMYESKSSSCIDIPDAAIPVPESDAAVIPSPDLPVVNSPDAQATGIDQGVAIDLLPVLDSGGAEPALVSNLAGFGETCAADADCDPSVADYCMKSYGAATGYCSNTGCAANCPASYKCCDCPMPIDKKYCSKASDATLLASMMGCTCS